MVQAETTGKEAKKACIRDRLMVDSEKMFSKPIKRQKLKTMEASNETVRISFSQGKVRTALSCSNHASKMLVFPIVIRRTLVQFQV